MMMFKESEEGRARGKNGREANTLAVYKFLLARIKQFAFSTLSFMNFELNLHKIAIKVQNGNQAGAKQLSEREALGEQL